MRCDRARAALSLRLDGERLPDRADTALDEHLGSCQLCRAFERRARLLRAAVRIRPAEEVPDLVEPIMQAVGSLTAGTSARPGRGAVRPLEPAGDPRPGRRPLLARLGNLTSVAAAVVVGLVAGSVLVGGPWPVPERAPLALADVARGVTAAATELDAYRARFAVLERNLDAETPVRELSLLVWFRSPDRFRLDVVDHSRPETRSPTDLSLVVNTSRWSLTAPSACPPGIGKACPPMRTVVRERSFGPGLPIPTDLVLPLDSVAASPDIELLGRGRALDREAVRLELPVSSARPLLAFTELGGAWRPFFPGDRVELWLDARSWFPLRYRVLAAGGSARDRWEQRFGLPDEPAGGTLFEVEAVELDEHPAAPGTFQIPRSRGEPGTDRVEHGGDTAGAAGEEGEPVTPPSEAPTEPADPEPPSPDGSTGPSSAAGTERRPVEVADLPAAAGYRPVAPKELGGIPAGRTAVRPAGEDGPAEALVAYARGLAWVEVGEDPAWEGATPYGPVGPLAEEVHLANGGVAYFEPATTARGRRLSLHADRTDVYLESNLPRARLLEIAGSLPLVGEPMPEAWRERRSDGGGRRRVEAREAAWIAPFGLLVPDPMPDGYALAAIEARLLEDDVALTLHLRHTESDLLGAPIRLHVAAGAALPPASSAEQLRIELPAGPPARWTPERRLLEWVADGRYVSIDGASLEREEAVLLAASLVTWTPPVDEAPEGPVASPASGAGGP